MIKVFCVIYMCTTVIVRICLNIILVNVSAVVTDSVMIILKHLAWISAVLYRWTKDRHGGRLCKWLVQICCVVWSKALVQSFMNVCLRIRFITWTGVFGLWCVRIFMRVVKQTSCTVSTLASQTKLFAQFMWHIVIVVARNIIFIFVIIIVNYILLEWNICICCLIILIIIGRMRNIVIFINIVIVVDNGVVVCDIIVMICNLLYICTVFDISLLFNIITISTLNKWKRRFCCQDWMVDSAHWCNRWCVCWWWTVLGSYRQRCWKGTILTLRAQWWTLVCTLIAYSDHLCFPELWITVACTVATVCVLLGRARCPDDVIYGRPSKNDITLLRRRALIRLFTVNVHSIQTKRS